MTKNVKKNDIKTRIIRKQVSDINNLKDMISELEIECENKEKLINSVDTLICELEKTIDELKEKKDEYDKLISELKEMRKVMNDDVFKGRWNIIKLLIK